ncbi:hypothetical protein BN946_scf184996.g33 [Trametes cinnabarina]|uniref:BZIP domain-containing protein n=1 Tax=Pycnoporus cinnabarinus TaxID=5643 RepID=A0A060S2I8_PYCCI|nr:hypothetical protein BN946_scf184996.g33 [Trametes cinnabarina]
MTPTMSSMSESHRDSSSDHPPSQQDRPERSRNAKAQARHRAKRKAYIEQLEQTVTKLQSVLALTPEQVAAIPPPLQRIRELEQENEILHREVEELRRQLELKNAQLRPADIMRRDSSSFAPLEDHHHRADREPKRRRTTDSNGLYVVSARASLRFFSSPCCITHAQPAASAHYPVHGQPIHLPKPVARLRNIRGRGGRVRLLVVVVIAPELRVVLLDPAEYAPAHEMHQDGSTQQPPPSASSASSSSPHQQRSNYTSSYGHSSLPPFSHSSQYSLVKLEDEPHYSSTPGLIPSSLYIAAPEPPLSDVGVAQPIHVLRAA